MNNKKTCWHDGKLAPVQDFPGGIPWEMHLRAYAAYCNLYDSQDALIDLEGRNCRGGFSISELDTFIPGWRNELTERTELLSEIDRLQAKLEAADALANAGKMFVDYYPPGINPQTDVAYKLMRMALEAYRTAGEKP